jgi:hypothetical protein
MTRFFGLLGRRRRPAGPRSVHDDCRKTYRYPAVGNEARLGWWSGENFREMSARLEDISQGGVSIVAEAQPPTAEVYLRLVRPTETDWALMRVIRIVAISDGTFRVGAVFSETCPYELFKTSRGFLLEDRFGAGSPEFDGSVWR